MVTTRRQARTEAERRGGYANENIIADQANEKTFVSGSIIETANLNDSIVVKNSQTLAQQPKITVIPSDDNLYTTRANTVASPQVERTVELPTRPEKVKRAFNQDDAMPTLKTRGMTSNSAVKEEKPVKLNDTVPARRESVKLTPKMKLTIFVCLAIALILAIAVIATGITLSQTSASVDRLASEIAEKQTVIASQQVSIAEATNPDVIRDEAIKLGMTDSGSPAITISGVNKINYPMPTEHTNGFDKFCDWLHGIIS